MWTVPLLYLRYTPSLVHVHQSDQVTARREGPERHDPDFPQAARHSARCPNESLEMRQGAPAKHREERRPPCKGVPALPVHRRLLCPVRTLRRRELLSHVAPRPRVRSRNAQMAEGLAVGGRAHPAFSSSVNDMARKPTSIQRVSGPNVTRRDELCGITWPLRYPELQLHLASHKPLSTHPSAASPRALQLVACNACGEDGALGGTTHSATGATLRDDRLSPPCLRRTWTSRPLRRP